MERKLSLVIDDRMAGIAAALIANNHVIVFREQIDHTALSFIAPVDAYDCAVCHIIDLHSYAL